MVRCSIAINTRQQHRAVRTTLFTEQNKAEDAQSLSRLTVPKCTPVSLRLALNDLNAKFYSNKNRQLRYFGMWYRVVWWTGKNISEKYDAYVTRQKDLTVSSPGLRTCSTQLSGYEETVARDVSVFWLQKMGIGLGMGRRQSFSD